MLSLPRVHRSATTLLLCTLVALGLAGAVEARPARPAPPLPPPSGAVVHVNTEAALQAAVRSLASNTTIVVAPGVYRLTRTLYVKAVSNVGIRGATGNADDVVLVGPGMAEPNYGSVPFGIWTGQGVNGVTIANLTIRDVFFHQIILNAGTQNPHIYNVRLVNAGEQFIKSNPDDLSGGVNNGILEYSIIEFTGTAKNDYTKGLDIQVARNWIVRHNLFRNIVAPPGQLAGPAILAWRGTSNTLVEGNTFVNCARGVMFGSDDYISPSHRGGIIRNNFFFRTSAQPGDVGIILSDSPDSQVLNNTLFLSGTYGSPLEYRYPGTRNVRIANNLHDGIIKARDGAIATLTTNAPIATPAIFVNAQDGDLHLSAQAGAARDRGTAFSEVVEDWDGQPRPLGPAFDIGADESGEATLTYQIGGRITDGAGSALPGVTLTLSGARSQAATTDANGAYAFGSLPRGAYRVTPARSGYLFTPGFLDVADLTQSQSTAHFLGVLMSPPSGSASAAFVRNDVVTSGSWVGTYGSQGYSMPGVAPSVPPYAQVSVAGAATWTWAASTQEPRALRRPAGSDRLAACWYSGGTFTIDIKLTDGASHQVALYSLDWDPAARTQRVDVVDATTGAVLDSRSMGGFQGGQYLVWNLTGHVTLLVSNTGRLNAVVSGLFFDAAITVPTVPSTGAAFVGSDRATGGSWVGRYGGDGHRIFGAAASVPTYAQLSVAGAATWTWAASTQEPRALQRPGGSDRLAACWYSDAAFTLDLNLTDGASHQVALYSLDWDPAARAQRIEVFDAVTGTLLDSRALGSFQGGEYLVWRVTGRVTFRISNSGRLNAVLSGVFFDR